MLTVFENPPSSMFNRVLNTLLENSFTKLLQNETEVYYKVCQALQSVTIITKSDVALDMFKISTATLYLSTATLHCKNT